MTEKENKSETLTTRPIGSTEVPLLVFVSSRQDDELARPRALAIETVENYPVTNVWAFEEAPASSEAARERYLRNADKADFLIWLIGSTTTNAVEEEVNACMRAQGRLLAFKLPATTRDEETEALIAKVSTYTTWKPVQDIDDLPAHISAALNDEILRGYRDPAPANHDQYLKRRYRESIADTKDLWTTLEVPENLANDLAEDRSIGHKLPLPTKGTLTITSRQGSGKTLAALRLYQLALQNRLQDHSQPLPVFLNARGISGDLNERIERDTKEHGSVYSQKILVIIDRLDETGRQRANQLLSQAQRYTDANQDVTIIAMCRPLPGLNTMRETYALPDCDEEEFLAIASKVAGRNVDGTEIPFREYQTRLPLFATIIGAYLRKPVSTRERTPSQMIRDIAQQALRDSLDDLGDAQEFLNKLGFATITSGESVEKGFVALKMTDQALLANSRIVREEDGKLDFTLAIFREWFAARAIVEKSVSLDEIDLTSDRWVTPLAIAINSEISTTGPEIMEMLSSKDPGMAGLVLDEVGNNWSAVNPAAQTPLGTTTEAGTKIRDAMENWKTGLNSMMNSLGVLDQKGDVPALGVEIKASSLTTSWYRGGRGYGTSRAAPRSNKRPINRALLELDPTN